LLSYTATWGELNDAEQAGIARATLTRRPPHARQLLDDGYLRSLHKAMFGEVWAWAGRYRTVHTPRALGLPSYTWGARQDVATDELRAAYVTALRRADRGELDDLVAFARS